MQLQIGEVEAGLDDAINNLRESNQELESYDDIMGDPKYLETHVKKLQV